MSRVERAQKLYDEQQAEIEHLEDYIRRFGAKFSHAAQAQDKRKKLERINLNRVEAPTDLETVEVCLRMLTYAHVCKRLPTSKPLRYMSSVRPHTLVAQGLIH